MGDISEWIKTCITSAIGAGIVGLVSIAVFFITFRHERKRTIFQCLYSGKLELYSKLMEELKGIHETASKSLNRRLLSRNNDFIKSLKIQSSYLPSLKLLAPTDVIDKAEMVIRSIKDRIEPLLEKSEIGRDVLPRITAIGSQDSRELSELERLDREIMDSCNELAHLLRKDLGALDEIGL
ncbi:hypothetical protein [uncultured Mesotoga sp.]|uniref:hypothetical protein n=2 Tax=Mesotoga TaxID=1184396 RepID=UPI0025953BA7|nr:hypothetical protein [uncultured Mesotoga sp.]